MGRSIYKKLDWYLIGGFLLLVFFGWINIYAALRGEDARIFDFSQRYGMHLIWIGVSITLAILIIFAIPPRFYSVFAWWFYILAILTLIAVILVGVEVKGSRSWLALGPVRLQPAEFSKITTSIALAALMGKYGFRFSYPRDMIRAFLTIGIPMLLIIMEKETGSALVYVGFLLVFYREGMSGWLLILGIIAIILFILTLVFSPFIAILVAIGLFIIIYSLLNKKTILGIIIAAAAITLLSFLPRLLSIKAIAKINPFSPETWTGILTIATAIFFICRSFFVRIRKTSLLRLSLISLICGVGFILSVQFIFNNILQDHQRARIESLLGMKEDKMGVGYNVHQSMIAIGSGGFAGKGFLNGTQTRFEFVPEQGTDFIFCTIGEEWGFLGAIAVLAIYLMMIIRIINNSEKNPDSFSRIYGYCVASCMIMHIVINICMTIGLMPVIGIPLPFLSYGGSSLIAFTILLFIFIRLDLERCR